MTILILIAAHARNARSVHASTLRQMTQENVQDAVMKAQMVNAIQ
jgi:hypothetical protein